MSFAVYLTPQANKDLKKLPESEKTKIKKKLVALEINIFAGKKLKGDLVGLYALRVWPYRIVYLISNKKEAWIVHILHRQGAYK